MDTIRQLRTFLDLQRERRLAYGRIDLPHFPRSLGWPEVTICLTHDFTAFATEDLPRSQGVDIHVAPGFVLDVCRRLAIIHKTVEQRLGFPEGLLCLFVVTDVTKENDYSFLSGVIKVFSFQGKTLNSMPGLELFSLASPLQKQFVQKRIKL